MTPPTTPASALISPPGSTAWHTLLVAGVGSLYPHMLFQAVGLGYGGPGAGLMGRRPRDPEELILPRTTMLWFVSIGLIMGAATLAVITLGRASLRPSGRPDHGSGHILAGQPAVLPGHEGPVPHAVHPRHACRK